MAEPAGTAPPTQLPAFGRDFESVRLRGVPTLGDLTPEWAWGGATGAGVRVAVIDSGIDARHPDLEGCVDTEGSIALAVDAGGNVVETRGPHDDAFGHGTACAGIIHSLAPEATITSIKVLGGSLTGRTACFFAGLKWAIEGGFHVINLSLGTTQRQWALDLYNLCDVSYFSSPLIVASANNFPKPLTFPSLYSSVISVACSPSSDPWRFDYSPEPPPEFLARGVNVRVPWLEGRHITTTGNSFATPHISGVVALVMSKHAGLRPFQIKTVLWATAANVREARA